ncbi:retrograde regulation protein 2 [Exophiala viscosa]|uniref:Retrograde regulation protein 2 n=1 Tax=Exophiala viscosa TaxID=2486360 RepID=A0AAN6DZ05_9EURO|nr:retrograde regulation protein 2 [Exophiala viscosa]
MATQHHLKTTSVSLSEPGDSSGKDVGTSTQQNSHDEPNRLQPAQTMSIEEFLSACKKVKWKTDLRLIFMAWLMYIFNYFDRNTIGAARVIGMQQSLDMTSTEFGLAVALLFPGYISMQIPSNFILTRLRPSLYLPACMVVWGGLSLAMAFVQTKGALYVVRCLLGFMEAPFSVGVLFLISSWYTRSELALRNALFTSAPMIGNAFSGLVSAAINKHLDGALGKEAWRWLFITGGERAVAEWRLILDAGQADQEVNEDWSRSVQMTLRDKRLPIFALMYFAAGIASSVIGFFPSVVKTLGFPRTNTLLLTVPPYIIGVIVATVTAWLSDRYKNCSFYIIAPLAVSIAGFIIAAATSVKIGARYFAMILMVAAGHGAHAVIVAWVQKTIMRPRTKRALSVAFVNCIGGLSHIIGSFMYPDRWAPRYVAAMCLNSVAALCAIILALVMRQILRRANQKIDNDNDAAMIMHDQLHPETAWSSEDERQARKDSLRYVI